MVSQNCRVRSLISSRLSASICSGLSSTPVPVMARMWRWCGSAAPNDREASTGACASAGEHATVSALSVLSVVLFLTDGGTVRRQIYLAKTFIPRGTEIVHNYVHSDDPEVGRWVGRKGETLDYSCRARDAVLKLRRGREHNGAEMPGTPGCAFCATCWRRPAGTAET